MAKHKDAPEFELPATAETVPAQEPPAPEPPAAAVEWIEVTVRVPLARTITEPVPGRVQTRLFGVQRAMLKRLRMGLLASGPTVIRLEAGREAYATQYSHAVQWLLQQLAEAVDGQKTPQ